MSLSLNLIFAATILFCYAIRSEYFVHCEINRDPNFPPKMMRHYYLTFTPKCKREANVTQATIDAFNDSEDFLNLPDDRTLKCYMLCQMEAMDMIQSNEPKLNIPGVFDNLEPLKPEHQIVFIRMGLKCLNLKLPADNDRCEAAYRWNVCLKKGDIHNYLLL